MDYFNDEMTNLMENNKNKGFMNLANLNGNGNVNS